MVDFRAGCGPALEKPSLIAPSRSQEDDIDGEHIVAFAEEDDPGTSMAMTNRAHTGASVVLTGASVVVS